MVAFSWDNVLLLQTSFLGDTVLTLPLVVELRRRFPVRKLTIVCQPASRDLLQDHPAIDDLIVDDKKRTDRGWAGLRAKAASLKAKRLTPECRLVFVPSPGHARPPASRCRKKSFGLASVRRAHRRLRARSRSAGQRSAARNGQSQAARAWH